MTELEKMMADARGCNERMKETNGLSRRKKKEPPSEKNLIKAMAKAGATNR